MFKNFLLIIIILLGRNENCYSQDSLIKTRILESICNDSKRTGDTVLVCNQVMNTIFFTESSYRNPELLELLSHEEMILLEKNCENEAQLFEWGDIKGDFVILDEDSLRTLFDYNTHDIFRLKKSFLSKRKIVIVKPKKLTYTYIHTSPIVRYDDLFFVFVSSNISMGNGSSCIYVFEINKENIINIKKIVNCYLH
jgi:hypothetical protein